VAARLARNLLHLLDNGFEALTIGDPLMVECGVLWWQPPRDCFALFLPGELKIRAVPAGAVASAGAVGLATLHPSLHQTSFADEADFTKARFELSIFRPTPTKLLSPSLIRYFSHRHTDYLSVTYG
jgi:hypothetical protein